MDPGHISEWLKSTVAGIIVLGAVGSIASAALLGLVRQLLLPLAKKCWPKLVLAAAKHFVKPIAKQMAVVKLTKRGENRFAIFYAFQVMKVVLWFFVASSSLAVFLYTMAQSPDTLLRRAVLVPLVLFFLAFWWGLRTLVGMYLSYFTDIDVLIETAASEIAAEKANTKSTTEKIEISRTP